MTGKVPQAGGQGAWGISILNGLLGDYLHTRGNSLAIDMALYEKGRRLALTRECLLAAQRHPSPRICLLVHGLGCTEAIWDFAPQPPSDALSTYGSLLQADFDYTPFCVRYNSGRSIAENGRLLNELLERLVACYPLPVEEILLIGHSMGGLVIRGACYQASRAASTWNEKVTRVFYLGSPHGGANLEKLGYVTAAVLEALPNPVTRLLARIGNMRSQGVKDLRYGAWADGGEAGADATSMLPAHARHYVVAATLTAAADHPMAHIMGDGLVVPPGAPGMAGHIGVPAERTRVFAGMHHFRLARDAGVYAQIKAWMADE